jgi:hypothetical protein
MGTMKLTEFRRAVDDEFGRMAPVLMRDTVIVELGNRTPDEAIAAGLPAREVWLAICRAEQVPRSRWYGAGRAEPKDR